MFLRRVLIAVLMLAGCYPERTESPTTGDLHVLVAESIAPPVLRQVDGFLAIYGPSGARITRSVVTSAEAKSRFILDTLRLVVTADSLTPDERQSVETMWGPMLMQTIALDGIVAVTHHTNPVERLTTEEIRGILRGTVRRWEQVSASNGTRGPIDLVADPTGDALSFVLARLMPGDTVRRRFIPSDGSISVLRSVSERPGSLGFVGVTWIDSAGVPAKQLEVLMTEEGEEAWYEVKPEAKGVAYSAHPAHIYRGYYPFSRKIYLLTKSMRGDLASGFGTYLTAKEGQRMFLEAGIVPGTQPIRLRGGVPR